MRRDAGPFLLAEVLGHRPGQLAVLLDQQVRQSAGATLLGPLLPGVELLARLARATGHDDRADVLRLEDAELGPGEVVGALDQLQAHPQVGLVAAEATHRLGVGHPRDRALDLDVDGAPHRGQHLLHQLDDVVLVDEGHFDVELGELRLPVGTEVLVAVAARDLVVPLDPADHQQLLEQLRALRQGVPAAGTQSRRHQEVAGTLRRGACQGRGLHLGERTVGQHVAGGLVDRAAEPDRARRRGASQVQVTVRQPRLLPHVDMVVDRERQRGRGTEDLDVVGDDLDLAGGQVRILVALRTC